MMGATQPFISGAISKTVNVPKEATVDEIMEAYIESWRLGAKAVSIYRDGSKRTQPLNTSKDKTQAEVEKVVASMGQPVRKRLPDERHSITHKFDIAGHEGYITVGLVRGRPARRAVPRDGEGRLDDFRVRRRVRAGDFLCAAVRRAAAGARGQVQPRALRAVGHDAQSRHPLREVDRRLHLPLARDEVPLERSAVPRGGEQQGRATGRARVESESKVQSQRRRRPTRNRPHRKPHHLQRPMRLRRSRTRKTRRRAACAGRSWCGAAAATSARTAGRRVGVRR